MPKTGTTSLNQALNALGIRTLHWLSEKRTLDQLEKGDLRLDALRNHDGVTDIIGMLWYKELDRIFPGSKFILTVRQKEDWLESASHFWPKNEAKKKERALYYYRTSVFGCLDFRRDHFWDVYEDHRHNVRRYFVDRPQDLLEIDICSGQGWEKLCPFLNIETPDIPFPHLNHYRKKSEPGDQQDANSLNHFIQIDSTQI
ncbi:hypothetical protein Pan97_33750 [Bremerella volcania]|uniref:Sulfotransferase family protein n=2 Tax=Bremerella volcania TaxID=2527984 RepID=A0A518CAT6_9BACT|nr:hypothetical protein Pan97_33750 [Bremerella volcania]